MDFKSALPLTLDVDAMIVGVIIFSIGLASVIHSVWRSFFSANTIEGGDDAP